MGAIGGVAGQVDVGHCSLDSYILSHYSLLCNLYLEIILVGQNRCKEKKSSRLVEVELRKCHFDGYQSTGAKCTRMNAKRMTPEGPYPCCVNQIASSWPGLPANR